MAIWCPYTNQELSEDQTSPEHIIPLSLGGCDEFTIPVDKVFNSKVGSKIDGKYSNDFLVMQRRNEYDARGHSKKRPVPTVKKGKLEDGSPVQVNLDKAKRHIEVFDPKTKTIKPAIGGETIGMSLKMDIDIHLQLASKIALSAGYFVYGDWFRNKVKHEDLRTIMRGPSNCSEEELKAVETRVYDFLRGGEPENQKQAYELQRAMCRVLKGSLVAFTPGPRNIGITVGILGEFVGMLNIPANMNGYPQYDKAHDLGHIVIITNGKMKRGNQRSYFRQVLEFLEKAGKDNVPT
ncbi:hypothetical protein BMS_0765 [Halobacteriovorax marinus SJ]|uniref:HNH endonuclease n=1 Tax=Halobacteriovorax marinus (strain ATCC BAA-682 / DSM 15412 / SJ) TaxID=862908 RepID=E1X5V2_HALMS|nr:hypothetical protein [Halobacteriovorax marinus]CBW25669.1 hypothetical protein BMS_0765 [Halobacteriovorax marinus SJ]